MSSPTSDHMDESSWQYGVANQKKRIAARKPRWVPTPTQLQILENQWEENPYPSTAETANIANVLLQERVTPTQVHRWFKHRREYKSKKGLFQCRESAEKFSKEQVATLEAEFAKEPYPHRDHREKLGLMFGVSSERIRNWFNARRVSLANSGSFDLKTKSSNKSMFTEQQLQVLDASFKENATPSPEALEQILKEVKTVDSIREISLENVSEWFQSKRNGARTSPAPRTPGARASVTPPSRGSAKKLAGKAATPLTITINPNDECAAAAAILLTPTARKRSEPSPTGSAASLPNKKPRTDGGLTPPSSAVGGMGKPAGRPLSAGMVESPQQPTQPRKLDLESKSEEQATAQATVTQPAMTPLMSAIERRDLNAVWELVRAGEDVNAVEPLTGATPMMIAAATGLVDAVPALYCGGRCNLNQVNKPGMTAMQLAIHYRHIHLLEALLKHGASPEVHPNGNSLLTACHKHNTECVKMLVAHGANVNVQDELGTTPLIISANQGTVDISKHLINAGALVNKTDSLGRTPLMAAARRGHLAMVRFLLESGANATLVDSDNKTAAQHASDYGHTATRDELNRQKSAAENTLAILAGVCY